MATVVDAGRSEDLEIQLLLEGIFQRYGHDFREYDGAALKPRIRRRVEGEGLATISGLQEKIIHDPDCLERFLDDLAGSKSGFFDDPGFFSAFRKKAVPILRTYPFVRVWQVGCAGGEAAYALAVLLLEEGLSDRTTIYVSDVNAGRLAKARTGTFPKAAVGDDSPAAIHYLESGGRRTLGHFYTADGDQAVFLPRLRSNIVFTLHNLVTDSSFNEFNVILCRNEMALFNPNLKKRIFGLLHASLCRFGFLCLGDAESPEHSPHADCYEPLERFAKLYRRTK